MNHIELVTYDGLPAASGGAHSLRTRKPSGAAEKVAAFLDACAVPEVDDTYTFQLWAGGDAEQTAVWRAFAQDTFGGAKRTAQTHREWNVRADRVDTALCALDAAHADAVTRYGRSLATLALTRALDLRDPDTDDRYRGVSGALTENFAVDGYGRTLGTSGIRATFGTTASSLSLWLSFPGDERLRSAVAHVQANLPVRLSAKHWRRWAPKGDGYTSRRIPSPLAD